MEVIIALSIIAIALSGVIALFPGIDPQRCRSLSAVIHGFSSLLGIAACMFFLLGGGFDSASGSSALKLNEFIRVDYISALFLIPVFFVTAAASVYGSEYIAKDPYRAKWRQILFLFGLLSAALPLVVCARQIYLFLAAWEIMALSAFFLVGSEGEKSDVRVAAWTYLLATHACTLFLIAFFCLFNLSTGGLLIDQLQPGLISIPQKNLLFGLALLGFGLKAGCYPLHFWLPPAHAAAPSHVSAVMSGVMLKIGVYGVVRILWTLSPLPVEWGYIITVIGVLSAVLGVVHAISQHDLKRLLAYHSVENIGIIFMALGLGVLGMTFNLPLLAMLGFCAAILHVWNHALFKGLLFLSAGAVVHATGTRTIDCLGGLIKRMPQTAVFFLIGAAAITGLPPLNGFVSEFLLYLGLGKAALVLNSSLSISAALCFAALALAGALALACFVKVFGVAFLGEARSAEAAKAGEVGLAMRFSMLLLALSCIGIGLFAGSVVQFFSTALAHWLPAVDAQNAEFLNSAFSIIRNSALLLLFIVAALLLILRSKVMAARRSCTWDCGYAAPSARMQYSASSFAEYLTSIYAAILRTVVKFKRPKDLFPEDGALHSSSQDLILRFLLNPLGRFVRSLANGLRPLQRSLVQVHVLYLVVTLIVLLLINGRL